MKKTKLDINKLLSLANSGPSQWELDNITWNDRNTNPATLKGFLERIQELRTLDSPTVAEKNELKILEDLSKDMDQNECEQLLSNDDDVAQQTFIENLARISALQVLTEDHMNLETMNIMCKLNPNDFILTAKRTQDIINTIHEMVIQGETLSKDVAGA